MYSYPKLANASPLLFQKTKCYGIVYSVDEEERIVYSEIITNKRLKKLGISDCFKIMMRIV